MAMPTTHNAQRTRTETEMEVRTNVRRGAQPQLRISTLLISEAEGPRYHYETGPHEPRGLRSKRARAPPNRERRAMAPAARVLPARCAHIPGPARRLGPRYRAGGPVA